MQLRPIDQSLPMQLLAAREAAMAHFRPMLRAHGLTEQQWRVIRVLAAQDRLDVSELATRALLLAPSLSRILQSLQADGLIERSPDPEDQRRYFISLSATGQARFEAVGPDSESLYRSIEAAFGREKLQDLYQLLTEFTATTEALRSRGG